MRSKALIFINIAIGSLFFAVFLAGCSGGGSSTTVGGSTGGGGGSGTNNVTISAIAGPSNVIRGVESSNWKYSATVSGSSDTTVNWASSNSATKISTSGVLTTPDNGSGTESTTITGTADANSSVSSTAAVNIIDGIIYSDDTGTAESNFDGSGTLQLLNSLVQAADSCIYPQIDYAHDIFTCTDINSNTTIDIFSTNSTAAGTKKKSSININSTGWRLVDNPTPTPDGKTIVFLGDTDNGFAIYSIPANDTVNSSGALSSPATELYALGGASGSIHISRLGLAVSADGKEIAFYNPSTNNIWEMGIDGSNPHVLVNQHSEDCRFSHDMNYLYWDDGTGNVYRMDLNTATSTEILSGGYWIDAVSPYEVGGQKGDDLIVVSYSTNNLQNSDLYAANSDGSNLKMIASNADNATW